MALSDRRGESHILSLLRLYELSFSDKENLAPHKIDAAIKNPLFRRKKELADEYVQNRFAMSHDDFLKLGKEKLPSDLFHDALQKIAAIDLKADLIVAGFVQGAQEIYICSSDGKAAPVMEFAVIGEGEYLAEAALLRRGQNDVTSLEETLYNVYEAKRQAEAVGSVGKLTSIRVLSEDGEHKLVSSKTRTQLRKLYTEYGPKDLPGVLTFDGPLYYEEETAGEPTGGQGDSAATGSGSPAGPEDGTKTP